jgi:hypothetical protein
MSQLMKKRVDNRDRILRAFEDIPFTFSAACDAIRIHPTDIPLRSYVKELFLTLVDEIPKLVNIVLRQHRGSCKSFNDTIFGREILIIYI